MIGKDDNYKVVYYAPKEDIAQMGAEYSVEVFVKSGSYIAKNFSKGCYSEDVNITTNFSTLSDENKISNLYIVNKVTGKLISQQRYLSDIDSKFIITIPKEKFSDGKASLDDITFNFGRVANEAWEPLDFFIKSLNITSNETLISSSINNLHNSLRFYYLRLTAPSYQVTSELNNTTEIFSEVYCKECDKKHFIDGLMAGNDVYWYRKKVTNTDINNIDSNISTSNDERIEIKEKIDFNKIFIKPKSIPLAIKVFYIPSYSWLLYDKYNPNVKKHSYILRFNSVGKWAGKGKLGNTVDVKEMSTIGTQVIDW